MKGEFIPLVRCPTLHFKSLRWVLQSQLVAMTKLVVQTDFPLGLFLLFLFLYTFPQIHGLPSFRQSLLKQKYMIPWRNDGFINLNNETMLSIYCFLYCFTDILLQLPPFWSRIVWWASYPWGILSCHLCSMQYFTQGVLLGIPRGGCAPGSPHPEPISDQKNVIFHTRF